MTSYRIPVTFWLAMTKRLMVVAEFISASGLRDWLRNIKRRQWGDVEEKYRLIQSLVLVLPNQYYLPKVERLC